MQYMLDTNMVSDLVRNPSGRVAQRVRQLPAQMVCTSIIVAGELHYGIIRKGSVELTLRVRQILQEIPILSLQPSCAEIYGQIRTALERKGLPIGANDLWIAAHAMSSTTTLVTHNVQEFIRIEGLRTENWLA